MKLIHIDTIIGDTAYSVMIKSTVNKGHEVFQNSEEFKEIAKSRYKIVMKIVS